MLVDPNKHRLQFDMLVNRIILFSYSVAHYLDNTLILAKLEKLSPDMDGTSCSYRDAHKSDVAFIK